MHVHVHVRVDLHVCVVCLGMYMYVYALCADVYREPVYVSPTLLTNYSVRTFMYMFVCLLYIENAVYMYMYDGCRFVNAVIIR